MPTEGIPVDAAAEACAGGTVLLVEMLSLCSTSGE